MTTIPGRKIEAYQRQQNNKRIETWVGYLLSEVMVLASLRKMWNMFCGSKMFEI